MSDFENPEIEENDLDISEYDESIFDTVDLNEIPDKIGGEPGRQFRSERIAMRRSQEIAKEAIILNEIADNNTQHRWGSGIVQESDVVPGVGRVWKKFEATEQLRAITADSKDSRAWESLDRVHHDLTMAHSLYPNPEIDKGHGEHCRASEEAKARCVWEKHHMGWWHSNKAALFCIEGLRSLESRKIPHCAQDVMSTTPGSCATCKHNKMVDEAIQARENRHDDRPELNERLHALHHKYLVAQDVKTIRIVDEKTGKTIGFKTERSYRPYQELTDDRFKSEEQKNADFQWREVGDVAIDIGDKVTEAIPADQELWERHSPQARKPVYEITPAHYQRGQMVYVKTKLGRKRPIMQPVKYIPEQKRLVKWEYVRSFEDSPTRMKRRYRRGQPGILKDTGSLPEPRREKIMEIQSPMVLIDKIESMYLDKKKNESNANALKGAEARLVKLLFSPDDHESEIAALRKTIKGLKQTQFTMPNVYHYNKEVRGWTNDFRSMEDWMFNLIRSRVRDVVQDVAEWGEHRDPLFKVELAPSRLHTMIAKEKGLLTREIQTIPYAIRQGAWKVGPDRKFRLEDTHPLGNLPFMQYHCVSCKKVTLHIRDVWAAGKTEGKVGELFHGSLWGGSGHTKCIKCGMPLANRFLKLMVTLKISNKPDSAIWRVTGRFFGEGFIRPWLAQKRLEGSNTIKALEIAQSVDYAVRKIEKEAQESRE